MDIKTFDDTLTYLGIVDNYNSVDFKTRFTSIGDFVICAPVTPQNLKRLAKGNFVMVDNLAGYIESVQLDEDSQEAKLTAVGYDLKGLLAHRINWGILNYSGTVENFFRKIVNENCIHTSEDRIIPFLELGKNNNFPEEIKIQDEGSLLSELITKQAMLSQIGWDVVLRPKEKKLIFRIFKGVDRTINQTQVTPLVFEKKRENILEQVYVDSDEGHKNVAYVAGAKENDKRTSITVVGSGTGFGRREMFLSGTSQRKNEQGEPIPESDYKNLLKTEGEQALGKAPVVNNFDCVVNTRSGLDFGVGDGCTVVEDEWGVRIHTYISETQRIYDTNGFTLNVVFGSNIHS